jgi:hypothetical protein
VSDYGLSALSWDTTNNGIDDIGVVLSRDQSTIETNTWEQIETSFSTACPPASGDEDCHYAIDYTMVCFTFDWVWQSTTFALEVTSSSYPVTMKMVADSADLAPGEY